MCNEASVQNVKPSELKNKIIKTGKWFASKPKLLLI